MHRRRHAQLRFHWSVRASLRGVRRSSCVDVSSESGELFGWGTNSAGQLGTGSTDTVKTAAPAAGLGGVRVVEAVASTSHTIVRAGMCKSRRTSTSVAHCCLVIVAVTQHRVRCTPPGTTRLGSLALATTTPGPVLPSLLCTASRTLCRCRQVPSIPWRAQVHTRSRLACAVAPTRPHTLLSMAAAGGQVFAWGNSRWDSPTEDHGQGRKLERMEVATIPVHVTHGLDEEKIVQVSTGSTYSLALSCTWK